MGFNASALNAKTVKNFVDRLQKQYKTLATPRKRSQTQEDVAIMLGYKNWHTLHQVLSTPLHAQKHPSKQSATRLVIGSENERHDYYSTLIQHSAPTLIIRGPLSSLFSGWNTQTLSSDDLTLHILSHINFDTMSSEEIYDITCKSLEKNQNLQTLDFIKNLLDMLVARRDDPAIRQKFDSQTIFRYLVNLNEMLPHAYRKDIPQTSLVWVNTYLDTLFEVPQWIESNIRKNHNEMFALLQKFSKIHEKICAPLRVLFDNTTPPYSAASVSTQVNLSHSENQSLHMYVRWWCNTHPTGLVIADGLGCDSQLYTFFLQRLAQDQINLILGAATAYDFPSVQLYEQIASRMDEYVNLFAKAMLADT